jgi:DNA-binding NarL/FixJ family response regulator
VSGTDERIATSGAVRAGGAPVIAVLQPQALLLEALLSMLEAGGHEDVAGFTDAGALLRRLRSRPPAVVLLDEEPIAAPEGPALLDAMREAAPGTRLVLLASTVDGPLARETVAHELDGVVLKSASASRLLSAVERVVEGDAVFPGGWLAAAHHDEMAAAGLSERQHEVLALLAQGLPNETIAERLYISRNTVKFHVAAIYERLGVRNRVQAARAYEALRADG